jgi:pyrroloquinoline quinone biosynthesis protein D
VRVIEPIPENAVPRLGTGMRLQHDKVRAAWIILGPERLFMPDEHAVAVLREIDGTRTLGAIVDGLAARYDAPRDRIAADVTALLRDLSLKGAVRL